MADIHVVQWVGRHRDSVGFVARPDVPGSAWLPIPPGPWSYEGMKANALLDRLDTPSTRLVNVKVVLRETENAVAARLNNPRLDIPRPVRAGRPRKRTYHTFLKEVFRVANLDGVNSRAEICHHMRNFVIDWPDEDQPSYETIDRWLFGDEGMTNL